MGLRGTELTKQIVFKPGPGLPLDIIVELKPIYASFSEDDLLSRCLYGKTQNQNESLNGMFLERVPKDVFVGAEGFQLGIYDAIVHFNIGSKAFVKVFGKLGISPEEFCMTG